ncbi:hypothetical protein, partial [Nostoc sp. FACHB-888]|uniref:hypothetical protein n=1 Tax=Nostoc sp. FACHB-888 TaxID=2692842 RepID=UPI001A7EBE51
ELLKRCENQSPSWIYPLFLHPLDKSAITLTSHRWSALGGFLYVSTSSNASPKVANRASINATSSANGQ